MTNRELNNLPGDLRRCLEAISQAIGRDLPIVIGKTATDHFRENFRAGGFVNGGLHKWADVKRRDSKSGWYGFEYKGEKRTALRLTRDRKTGKTKRAARQKLLNFSSTATIRAPLSSKRMELYNSLRYYCRQNEAIIATDKPYAQVQNEGGPIKVFGKRPARITARPFMGQSRELDEKVGEEINKRIDRILNI